MPSESTSQKDEAADEAGEHMLPFAEQTWRSAIPPGCRPRGLRRRSDPLFVVRSGTADVRATGRPSGALAPNGRAVTSRARRLRSSLGVEDDMAWP